MMNLDPTGQRVSVFNLAEPFREQMPHVFTAETPLDTAQHITLPDEKSGIWSLPNCHLH